jgi:hypothetical protein
MTANNSSYQTTASSYTLSNDSVYLFQVKVNADASISTFSIYDGITEELLWTDTLGGGLGTTTTRSGGVGIVATESSVVSKDIGIIYWMGFGTPAGFAKARG